MSKIQSFNLFRRWSSLGVTVDSEEMTLSLPQEEALVTIEQCHLFLTKDKVENIKMLITLDDSMKVWGSCYKHKMERLWSNLEAREQHINVLELKAATFVIMSFSKMFPNVKVVHLQMDCMVALSFIKRMGDTHGVFTKYSQCECQISALLSYGLKQINTKSQKIQNNLQGSRDS